MRAGDERGTVVPLIVLALTPMVGMAALTLDLGRYYEVRRQLQNAADAAAHAGAQQLPDFVGAEHKALEYFDYNRPTIGTSSFEVEFPNDQRMRVVARVEVPMIFAQLFGVDTLGAEVVAQVATDTKKVDIVVVLDRSGSMCRDSHPSGGCPSGGPWDPFNAVQNAALGFPQYVLTHPEDRLALVSYATAATSDLPLIEGYANVIGPLQTQVGGLEPAGYTNFGHALSLAHSTLLDGDPEPGRRQIIVLLSDGVPNVYPDGSGGWTTCGGSGCAQSHDFGLDEADNAAADNIEIYTIGLGVGVNGGYLAEIAEIGGGSYIYSPSSAELEAAFAQVARLVKLTFIE